jgi:hypothetical protein
MMFIASYMKISQVYIIFFIGNERTRKANESFLAVLCRKVSYVCLLCLSSTVFHVVAVLFRDDTVLTMYLKHVEVGILSAFILLLKLPWRWRQQAPVVWYIHKVCVVLYPRGLESWNLANYWKCRFWFSICNFQNYFLFWVVVSLLWNFLPRPLEFIVVCRPAHKYHIVYLWGFQIMTLQAYCKRYQAWTRSVLTPGLCGVI